MKRFNELFVTRFCKIEYTPKEISDIYRSDISHLCIENKCESRLILLQSYIKKLNDLFGSKSCKN